MLFLKGSAFSSAKHPDLEVFGRLEHARKFQGKYVGIQAVIITSIDLKEHAQTHNINQPMNTKDNT
jgi:2-iminoacetate synthase ThiH